VLVSLHPGGVMKYSFLFFTLFFSQLLCAESVPGNWKKTLKTDESCEVQASFWKLENSSAALIELQATNQPNLRLLGLKKEEQSDRDLYYSVDEDLPSFEVRMTFDYENSLPLLRVFYSGRYFTCTMNHVFEEDSSKNVGSIGH
jgi:hypothetical protein